MKRSGTVDTLKKMISLTVVFLITLYSTGAQELPVETETETPGRTTQRAINASETAAEKHRREITEETSAHLFNMNIWDTNVSLFLSGYWKGSLSLNWGLANSPLGTAPETKNSPLLFTQEADLTLSLWIWQKWFLEVSFLDNYNLNTYRAGYQGLPGETIQYVGIGNTGLDFPVFPYLDLGGDSPSSFGAYGRFGSENLTFHALVRYDAAAREERVFVGNRERSFSTVSPNKPLRGRSFVLPDENINSIPVIYFEDKDGPLSGGDKRWRIATPSEYAVNAFFGLVELVREPPGMVAVSYTGGYSMGTYTSSGFLRKVQEHFDDSPTPVINLTAYPQPGQRTATLGTSANIPGIIVFDTTSALVIYEPGTFSPFERQSRYMAPSNNTEDAALISLSSGERLSGFEVVPANTLSLNNSIYTLTGDDTSRNIFEIVSQKSSDRRSTSSLWPLTAVNPELYLPGAPVFNEDVRLRFTSYGTAGTYNIGTDVIPGSVFVYRGGILDSQISYDSGSGNVTLTSPVSFNEVIRITYLKRSEERRLGSFAAGVGLNYKPENSHFTAEAALGMRWNIFQEAYTEEGATSPGTVGLSARTTWNYNRLKASLSLGIGFEQPDTTGLYRIAGMEGNSEIVLGVSTSSGFISESPNNTTFLLGNRVPLVYRNYRKSDWLGGSELQTIDWNAPEVSGLQGPYPAKDGKIDVFVAEFKNLNNGEWTGFQIPLGRDGELLEQARTITIPLRLFYDDPDIEVHIQFGTLAEEGYGGGENPELMVEFSIPVPPASAISSSSLEIITIHLTDSDRRKLRNANQMRIIIQSSSAVSKGSNRLLVAKPFIMGASWRPITVDGQIKAATDESTTPGNKVTVMERYDSSLQSSKINRLHENNVNHVLEVTWAGKDSAGADGRTSSIPLSNYRVLSFYLKIDPDDLNSDSIFYFLVGQNPEAYHNPGKSALRVAIKLIDFKNSITPDPSGWYNIEIYYHDRYVLINNQKCITCEFDYNPGIFKQSYENSNFVGDEQSCYIATFVTSTTFQSGTFSIDEICLEEPSTSYRINGGATLDWRHPESLISIKNKAIVSGAVFNTALESAALGNPFESGGETFTGIQSRSRGELNILGAQVTGNLNFTVSNDINYWSAGHGISRSFGPLSISESFNTSPPSNEETMDHSLSLRLNTPVYGNLSSSINYQHQRLTRNWAASTGIQSKTNGRPGFSLEGTLQYLEKNENVRGWMHNYAETWLQGWTVLFPDNGSDSDGSTILNRDIRSRAGFNLDYLPVGAELSFEGNNAVSIPLEFTRSGSIARIEAPFSIGNIRGRIRSQRDISQAISIAGKTVDDDFYQYGQSFSNTSPLWKNAPVFVLFNSKLSSAMDKTKLNYNEKMENIRFHEVFALNMLFPERYDWFSLFVPISHYTQFDRTMEQRMDTQLDVLTVSSGFGFSSINLFGAMGTYSLFKFYRNDELRHSIAGIFSIPRYEDPLWRIQAEQNMRFFGFNGAELDVQNAYTISGGSRTGWTDNFILLWTIPREKTLLASIYRAGMDKIIGQDIFPALSDLASSEHELFFRETMELVLDYSDKYGLFSLTLGHESVVRILGRLTLTGFAKLGVQKSHRNDTLSLLLNFGTTLNVSF